jgi:hypothetical protein
MLTQVGPVHMIALNSYAATYPGSAQVCACTSDAKKYGCTCLCAREYHALPCVADGCSSQCNQHAWLAGDLATIDRERTPWVVVIMHVPWYNSNLVSTRTTVVRMEMYVKISTTQCE